VKWNDSDPALSGESIESLPLYRPAMSMKTLKTMTKTPANGALGFVAG